MGDIAARGIATDALDRVNLLRQAFAARNVLAQRSAGRKMSDNVTGDGIVTSLPSYADGIIKSVLGGRTVTNFIINGNFANGTSGWSSSSSTLSASNNVLSITGNGGSAAPGGYRLTNIAASNGQKIYVKAKARVTNAACGAIQIATYNGTATKYVAIQTTPAQDTYYPLSGIVTQTEVGTAKISVWMQHTYADSATATGQVGQIMEVLAIDLTAMYGAGNEPDAAICDKIFANWFDGTKSAQAQRVKAVGKNLIRNGNGEEGLKYLSCTMFNRNSYSQGLSWSNGFIVETSSINGVGIETSFIPVLNGQQYTIKGIFEKLSGTSNSFLMEIFCFDRNLNLLDISGLLTGLSYSSIYKGHYVAGNISSQTFTVNSPQVAYIKCKFGLYDYAVTSKVKITQMSLVMGSTALSTYEPYAETVAYIPGPLRSLPNNVRDTIDVGKGQKIKNVSDIIALLASNVTVLDTSNGVNVDLARVPVSVLTGGRTDGTSKWVNVFGKSEHIAGAWDDAANIGLFSTRISSGYLDFIVAKGTYANLAAAQSALAGVMLIYQLATPVTTYYRDLGQLDALPNGAIIVEPIVRGCKLPDFGTGQIAVTTADAPITSIESVCRIDTDNNGQQIKVDVTSSFTIDSGNLSINSAGADPTKPYEYVCMLNSDYSTIPVLTYSYPEADTLALGVASHSYGGAAADWTLSASEIQCGVLVCTSAGGAANVVAPDRKGTPYWVQNDSSQTLTVKKSGGTGATIATGKKGLFIHTGTDYVKFTEI